MVEEVQLWRGSAEDRALRGAMERPGLFRYFDRQLGHPDWAGKAVLDFGGNVGYILRDPGCTIAPERYYCLDVIREAIDAGRSRSPSSHWVHYDRYNFSFNPGGVPGLPVPDLGMRFDVILAFSVFTHTGPGEMCELVGQLRDRLAFGGTLAFTFIDPHHRSRPEAGDVSNLRWRLERCRESDPALDVDGLLERARGAAWCTLVNGRELYVEADVDRPADLGACETYHTYYGTEYLRSLFPDGEILQPVEGQGQHCCLLGPPA